MTVTSETRALQKFLQDRGWGSRRDVQALIAGGEVSVDGSVVTRFAEPIGAGQQVEVQGFPVGDIGAPFVYLMHKPKKHLTKLVDPEGKPALGQYLPSEAPFVFPVGRLDYNSEGALLFTNDGILARRVLHPDYALEKWYAVKVRADLQGDEPALDAMRAGMEVDLPGFDAHLRYKPAQVEVGASRSRATWLHITISEGKNRQVRNMCAQAGLQIVKLRRMAIGPIALGDLNPRVVRVVDGAERDALYRAVGLVPPSV